MERSHPGILDDAENITGLKLRLTINDWCVTLQVSLLNSNILAASRTLQKK
ncbi:MAG: hypothetical protein QNJ51_17585 [Calothrix sp. MO_167.B12]|nr:hypothetical protein [Calothrix sp. MO_167.B12]